MGVRLVSAFLLLALGGTSAAGAFPRAHRIRHSSNRQRRIYTNDLFTIEPGTVEIEFGMNAGSDLLSVPTTLKYEPDFAGPLLRQLEFSISSDTLTVVDPRGQSITQFANQHTVALLRPFFQRNGVAFAVQPQSTFFTRGQESPRLGTALLAGWSRGAHSLIGNVSWSAATHSSPANPAHEFDYDLSYVYSVRRSRLSLLSDVQWTTQSALPAAGFVTAGVVIRVRRNLLLDAALRRQDIGTGQPHTHMIAGVTWNLGRVGHSGR